LVAGALASRLDLGLAAVLAGLPLLVLLAAAIIRRPGFGLWLALSFSFLAAGASRYVPLPWGLAVDLILALCILGLFFQQFRSPGWAFLKNDAMLLAAVWFGFLLVELLNPEAPGPVAWAYAVRGIGMYNLFIFAIAFIYLRRHGRLDLFLKIVLWLSVLGALWGFRQQFAGLDAAEKYWIWEEGHHDEHVLHGVLRVFSFYSDAGQFGASQAMIALMCGVLVLGPFPLRKKAGYALVALLTLFGFLFSGTRGALAVPAAGVLVYLVLSKNFKVLAAGLLAIGLVFYLLKFTFIMHSFQPVARLRTALSVDNPSLQARLRNQETFGNYLRFRPLGGGVGSAGYWGERFRPGSLLAETPTDSYYVKIWAETGLVGICLHLLMLGYFLGKGSFIVWRLRDPELRYKAMALLAAFGGVLLASYGNQVYSQFPTGIIMPVALAMIFMAPHYDEQIAKERSEK
ncbi:MAG: O-antigen ligase family protein, partial [Phaeodactylibacter sp.]|nr:O-antigen ligase family protein [Phaeodactylibacter sp.]